MSLERKHIIFWLPIFLVCCIGFTAVLKIPRQVSAVIETKQKVFEAGETISLNFKLNIPAKTQLFLHASFGSTVLESDTARYILPEFISNKKGIIYYMLLHNSKIILEDTIEVKTNTTSPVQLESYVGPPSIIAGGTDYTMQVVVPTDVYDNPLPDSTAMRFKHQFLDTKKEEDLYSKDMIGWVNIFSYEQSGRLLISSKVKEVASKEFSVEIFPSLPQDFQISSKRRHSYADGNQITKFITSTLKDDYGNIVSDGTLVEFKVKNKNGTILQTQGSTVNGQAIGKMLHPDHQDIWEITAFIPGIAKSNVIQLEYAAVLNDLKVKFSENNREIIVGPLLSFMEQLIPDGAIVTLKIENDKSVETKIKTSSDGIARFILKKDFYPSGEYTIKIKALGAQKEFSQIPLQ
ncbi:hypothetical protein [uncultured Aquimarina sp.]|uniref:hypothetical protein n=1 Tax=uncultured Aquimarina sp. TaxID=575652 RepID=UPI002620F4C6|nr:hypothetical protein [uncultured Aquimarina sp.]